MGGKISREKLARPMPINRLCIGCGAVWQSWCYWWCGGARVVVLGGGSQPTPRVCTRRCHQMQKDSISPFKCHRKVWQ